MPRGRKKIEQPCPKIPAVVAGMRVRCRCADGRMFESIAYSEPRYDHRAALGWRVYLTVLVGWGGPDGQRVNWTAEDVEVVG